MLVFQSEGIENVLHALQTRASQSVFPPGIDAAKARITENESPNQWLVRCINEQLRRDPKRCMVESEAKRGLAVFANIIKSDEDLKSVHIQALVTDGGNITELYEALSEEPRRNAPTSHYFRLDFDRTILGAMFRQPLAHVHIRAKDEPLFPLNSPGGNLLLDFFDFLYRNFFYERWLSWARDVWSRGRRRRGIDEGRDPWLGIENAYKTGQHEYLRENQQQLSWVRGALQQAKDDRFPLRAPAEDIRALAYP